MTEPTQAQLTEAKQLRAKYAFSGSLDVYTHELARLIAHIRREARNAALDDAAKVCDSVNSHDNPMTATDCAESIRALKDQP